MPLRPCKFVGELDLLGMPSVVVCAVDPVSFPVCVMPAVITVFLTDSSCLKMLAATYTCSCLVGRNSPHASMIETGLITADLGEWLHVNMTTSTRLSSKVWSEYRLPSAPLEIPEVGRFRFPL